MVIAGGAGDRCSASGRSIVLIVGLLTATAGLLALMAVPAEAQSLTPVLFDWDCGFRTARALLLTGGSFGARLWRQKRWRYVFRHHRWCRVSRRHSGWRRRGPIIRRGRVAGCFLRPCGSECRLDARSWSSVCLSAAAAQKIHTTMDEVAELRGISWTPQKLTVEWSDHQKTVYDAAITVSPIAMPQMVSD